MGEDQATGQKLGRYDFEAYRRATPRRGEAFATLDTGKRLSVSAGATRMFGKPEAVELLYDRQSNAIGVRPASLKSPDAYKVQARGRTSGGKASGFSFSLQGFCEHYGLSGMTGRRYAVELYDGVLVCDLNRPLGGGDGEAAP